MDLRAPDRRRRSQLDAGRNLGRAALTPRRIALVAAALLIAAVLGFLWWRHTHPMQGPLRLTRVAYSDLPGWAQGDAEKALASFRRGCDRLAALPPGQAMGGKDYAGTVGDWLSLCRQTSGDARNLFEKNFTPFIVSAGDMRDALFTGYYEPQIRGSRTNHGAYLTPVYGLPPDLIRVDLGSFLPALKGEHLSGRLVGQKLVPYADRAAIDAHGIANAKILFWCDDPVALFFLQIQGSGRVVFDDGSAARIAYAGENGQPYTAIGRVLIKSGALTRQTVSLATIRDWLKSHPDQARGVMEVDRSFVFFQEAPLGDTALGSPGTLGVPLTPLASIAVDPRLHALGALFFVAADGPDPVHVFATAQDTGGAIRGAARADIFFGFGADAERRAGALKAPGTLYVLLPNAVAARIGAEKDFP